ncbi:hypothetical protein [Comamonas thiooxydans]|uniref:hypothetical protein n=1 Tax=Comamonas thiooxydans TaxID=363952 RepID=UPI00050E618C|nr:hypothetical protein [Comamonas thiooxydans]KGH19335.1 hypothetical protein P606_23540 [Comamonas thiooxydans]
MRPLERFGGGRTWGAAVLCLCLSLLLGTATRAGVSAQEIQHAGPVMTASVASHPMPSSAEDCQTCAACAIAPAPAAYAFTGEGEAREQAPVAWLAHATAVPAPIWFFDAGGGRLRCPVRIAFCRWLD